MVLLLSLRKCESSVNHGEEERKQEKDVFV